MHGVVGTRRRWRRAFRGEIVGEVVEGTAAGYAAIDEAKRNGSWTALDNAENLAVPDDLANALRLARAHANFDELAPSRRRNILYWINSANRPDTRRRRIDQTAVSWGCPSCPFVARLAAMDSAARDIEERLERLRTEHQMLRQTEIIEELLDVVSGYEVLRTE